MKLRYSYLLSFVLCGGLQASAQVVVERPHTGSQKVSSINSLTRPAARYTHVIVRCGDAASLVERLAKDGIQATLITGKVATVRMATDRLAQLYNYDGVESVQLPRTAQPSMVKARQATGVDRIQQGDGLDTPYTGKGVVIGVIDQGFEYKHLAFLKDDRKTSRVVALWNRKGYNDNDGVTADPIEDSSKIPASGDGFDSYGHATHVTNIAAGSRIKENDFYGMAPDADIVMIPSEFSDAEVLEDVKYVQQWAEKRNQPWVINMSFGTQVGAHDGQSDFGKAVDEILTTGKGHQVVIAAGNENVYRQHAQHTFAEDGETVRLLVSTSTSDYGALIDLWGQATDGEQHMQVRPFFYNDGKIDYKTDSYWQQFDFYAQIADFNQKEHYLVAIPSVSILGKFGLEITGEKGQTFHAWTNSGYGNFTKDTGDGFVNGDTNYCVDDFGSSIDHAVVAAAYVTSNTWTDYNGKEQSDYRGKEGDIANFSSHGPSLSAAAPCKPTVAAPGSCLVSAVAKTGKSFDTSSSSIASIIKVNALQRFYYEQMSGTSMASPSTAGIIALWLQANPNLTSLQILDIIKATSSKDQYTGSEEWNNTWGYGKINAYEGLKEALRLADATGITAVCNSTEPVSILRSGSDWKILLGSDERFMQVSVYTVDGNLVASHHYVGLQRGDEKVVDFGALSSGVYVVRVCTANSTVSKKLAL